MKHQPFNITVFPGRKICFHPKMRSTLAQRWMLDLGLKGLNAILAATADPDRIFNIIINLGRWLSGLQSKHQSVGQYVWPYLSGGKGDPVVFLHGFGADKDRFGSLAPFFRRTFRVVIPDIPGFGDHQTNWSATYTIHDQARRLEKFLQSIGLQGCGHIPIIEHPTLTRNIYQGLLSRISPKSTPLKRPA